ncbi:MAG: hypothetical protein AAF823_09290 [Planctomycetota bacterium]
MTRNAPRTTHRLTTLAALAAALAVAFIASPALAQDGPREHEAREPRQERPRFLDRERVEAFRNARGQNRPFAEPRTLTDEEFDVAAGVLETFLGPEAAERLRAAADQDPHAASNLIFERFPRIVALLEMRRRDPLTFDLRRDELHLTRLARAQAEAIRQAVANDQPLIIEARTAELRETVSLQLEIRRELRAVELDKLQARIAELTDELALDAAEHDARVQARVAELTDPDRPLRATPRPFDNPFGPTPDDTRNAAPATLNLDGPPPPPPPAE